MVRCSAPNCSNNSRQGYRVFIFPKDEERRKIWLINCRRDKWKPTSSSRLCEVHFESNQFENARADGWKKLKPNAIPTIFNVPNPPKLITPETSRSNRLEKRRRITFSAQLNRRFKFNVDKDIELLKSVLAHDPWQYGRKRWTDVAADMKKKYNWLLTSRAVRERCQHLMQKFKREDLKPINSSSTEEKCDERATLLKEVVMLEEGEAPTIETHGQNPSDEDDSITLTPEVILPDDYSVQETKRLRNQDNADHLCQEAKEALNSSVHLDEIIERKKCKKDVVAERILLECEIRRREMDLRERQVEAKLEYKREQLQLEKKRLEQRSKELELQAQQQQIMLTVVELLKSK